MIDTYLLEELVAYAKYGTLAATAEALNVTQPTVTRGMQKLEDELGVRLFDRKPNRISLTKTGKLAAEEARILLEAEKKFVAAVQQFDFSQQTVRLASVAPGPFILLENQLEALDVEIVADLVQQTAVADALISHRCSLVFSSQDIQTDTLTSDYIGTEFLSVSVDKMTVQAKQTEIPFANLNGMTFIVRNDIGAWKEVIQREIPKAKFIFQDESENFLEILDNSTFPHFTTNLVQHRLEKAEQSYSRRTNLAIIDDSAQMDFYLTYLRDDKKRLAPIIKKMQDIWGQAEFEED